MAMLWGVCVCGEGGGETYGGKSNKCVWFVLNVFHFHFVDS